ncbi:hypothetical protein BA1DRAFT_02995 [Photorhabdus aegyptia]|uniref:Uncharacterized protein n=1 Tax=Photorhabdus aegyptia TaxID=2805098 RepID=A0A022PHX6_9GAMM|nr:hypothetical protein BA1DRAFT_02995 [Photorhabdus aegyptia]
MDVITAQAFRSLTNDEIFFLKEGRMEQVIALN